MDIRILEANRGQALAHIRQRLRERGVVLVRAESDPTQEELVEYADHNGLRLNLRLHSNAEECHFHVGLGYPLEREAAIEHALRLSYPVGVTLKDGTQRSRWLFQRSPTAASIELVNDVSSKLLAECYSPDREDGFHDDMSELLDERNLEGADSPHYYEVFELLIDCLMCDGFDAT